MMNFDINKLVFNPMVPFSTMLYFSLILLVIVLLNRRKIVNRLLIILLTLIISQRPMIKDVKVNIYNQEYDVIFVVDNTVSMNAMDVNNMTRFDSMKRDIKNLVEDFAGARFAVISYSNVAQLKYPFTRSSDKILDTISKLKTIDPNYAKGSSLGLPYEYMKMLLESSRTEKNYKTIVFFMSDGETSNNDLGKYENLKDLIDSGAVLGYGKIEGSKIKITESANTKNIVDNDGFLINSDTNMPYISKLNEDNLKSVANKLGLNYYHMTDYSVLQNKTKDLRKNAMDSSDEIETRVDIYYFFSGILVILLFFELLYYRRNV